MSVRDGFHETGQCRLGIGGEERSRSSRCCSLWALEPRGNECRGFSIDILWSAWRSKDDGNVRWRFHGGHHGRPRARLPPQVVPRPRCYGNAQIEVVCLLLVEAWRIQTLHWQADARSARKSWHLRWSLWQCVWGFLHFVEEIQPKIRPIRYFCRAYFWTETWDLLPTSHCWGERRR